MVFSSLLFLFRFLPVMLILYFAVPRRFRNGVLFLGSLFFYGWGEPVYISLLLCSTAVDFIHGKLIGGLLSRGDKKKASWVLTSSVIVNLGILGFFKYTDFIIHALNQALGTGFLPLSLPLPIGISFYTFQTMSYTIDVYRGQAKVQNNIISFGAYVSMFPQLIAGPIVRYHTVSEELSHRLESYGQFAQGVRLFIIGLGKKLLLANPIGALWNQIQGLPDGERTVAMVWLGIFSFGMQIYFDFSGYSDMAVGLGHMFGFHFPENFRYPYMAASITDFWRRWHISLGMWFKEYVYIPLGGNRAGRFKQVRNILIVWMLTGIWHGAGWNFLLWGLWFGIWLLMEKFLLRELLQRLPKTVQRAYAMMVVFLGWVMFSQEDMTGMTGYLGQMFGSFGLPIWSRATAYLFLTNLPLIVMTAVGSTPYPAMLCRKTADFFSRISFGKQSNGDFIYEIFELACLVFVMVLCVAYLVDATYNPFLYFRF